MLFRHYVHFLNLEEHPLEGMLGEEGGVQYRFTQAALTQLNLGEGVSVLFFALNLRVLLALYINLNTTQFPRVCLVLVMGLQSVLDGLSVTSTQRHPANPVLALTFHPREMQAPRSQT